MGVEFLHGVENFHQGEVLFVQAAHNFLHAAKMQFMQLYKRAPQFLPLILRPIDGVHMYTPHLST